MADWTTPAWQLEVEAREVNAQPWKPLPGMAKKRCSQCHYWFAVPEAEARPCRAARTAAVSAPGHSRRERLQTG